MKYTGMPAGMWILFENSFRKQLTDVLNFDKKEAETITIKAKEEYKRIIEGLPEFEKEDLFKMNIVNCAMLCAFILNMNERPSVDKMAEYFEKAMMILPMKLFCKIGGKNKYSVKDLENMRKRESLRAADRNPYSWNMELFIFEDGKGYEARFSKCGICTLMKELGLYEYTPAMCKLDYAMSEESGVTDFVRKYTLATGGPYCDCGYYQKKK